MGYCVMENRQGLVVASEVTQLTARAEREAALRMARSLKGAHQKTLGADKGSDIREFVVDLSSAVSRTMLPRTSRPAAALPLMAAPFAIPATPNRSTLGSGSSRFCLDSTGRWAVAAESERALQGRGGVSAACGGPQPDPHPQPAQGSAGDGMTRPDQRAEIQ